MEKIYAKHGLIMVDVAEENRITMLWDIDT